MKFSLRYKLIGLLVGLVFTLSSPSTYAVLISVDAQADMSSGGSIATDYIALGTTVTADVQFEIGPGPISSSIAISNVSGIFSWNDGSDRVFTASGGSIAGYGGPPGYFDVSVRFFGTGPTINSADAEYFYLTFDVLEAPDPYSVDAWELISTGSIQDIAFTARRGLTGNGGYLQSNVSGTITATVPEPATMLLMATGLAGLGFSNRKKKQA